MNISELEAAEAELSHHPESYFGEIDDVMDQGFSNGMFAKHRDSDVLEVSNFECVKEILSKWIERSGWDEDADGNDYYDGAVYITSSSHWAVGWVETIHVRMRNKHGKFTKAFRVACNIAERLKDYPVLDEEDYSKREYEDLMEWLDTEVTDVEGCAQWLFEVHSVSRSDDVRYEWITEWRKEHQPEDE